MRARTRLTTVLGLTASVILLTASSWPSAPQDAATPAAGGEASEDAEILRRILVQALEPAPGQSTEAYWRTVTALDRASGELELDYVPAGKAQVSHSRAFHVPGSGVFLCLDVTVPARQVRVDPPPAETNGAADDLWARVEREVRGTERDDEAAEQVVRYVSGTLLTSARQAQDMHWTLDPEHVAKAERAVVEALARHGARLEHLGGDESITVALHLSAGGQSAPLSLTREETVNWSLWASTVSRQRAPDRKLVVQLACRDIDRHARGDFTLDELEACAAVHRD